jgi:enoyl-CoA hydratase/carnithine racemase
MPDYPNYEAIEVERQGRVEIIRFNRPEALNSFSTTMTREWVDALEAANADPEVGAIVSTGNGRAYSSGADIGNFARRQAGEATGAGEAAPRRHAFDPHYLAASKPIIGAINGYAIGMGFTGPLNFDTLIASTQARFSARFAAIGLTPEIHSTWLLPKVVGLHRAKEMMLTGRLYTAAEALELGLVHRVVEPDELIPAAVELAAEIARNPETTLRKIKELVWLDLRETDFEVTQRRSAETFSASVQSIEGREAVRAFQEKREPRFHDREHMARLAEELAARAAATT